ncbi:DUF1223 domain-containing protein [Roseomonas sp. CCTCC AB2023176]|uniref:DUF1223 domain-containing protein n=1 Tax=Roseomonas sp. CCTCC AB2023176 TaxID=3342640 RepID=UPI0035DED259
MRRRSVLAVSPALLSVKARASGAVSPAPARRIVVELFTSQGCSSCPPADAFLLDLAATRPEVLPLSFHVTYWNRLGWRDPFSLEEATERQRRYAPLLRGSRYAGTVFTPQAVVQGRQDAVGSDRAALLAAIRAASEVPPGPSVRLERHDDMATVRLGQGAGAGDVLLIGYDARHVTEVGRGENAGRRLTHVNVVRGLRRAGAWRGEEVVLDAPSPPGERLAVILQAGDGTILNAAVAG